MFKLLFKEVARRVAADARDITQRLVSPEMTTRMATGAARALTRNWAAANILAEASAARWSASTPVTTAPDAPIRVLFAARFGALSPSAEAHALDALTALEDAAAAPRTRPIEITLCGTRALSPAGAPTSALARRILRHRVLDATVVSAADVAAWVGEHDIVLTCNDFGVETTATADLELAAMALGFARARGLTAVGLGVASELLAFSAPARDFLRRFGQKAIFGALSPAARDGLLAAGFGAFQIGPQRAAAATSDGTRVVLVLASPYHDGGSTVASPVAEAVRLGALLLGGPAPRPPAPPTTSPADVVDALRRADIPVSVVRVGPACEDASVEVELLLADGQAWATYVDGLAANTRVMTDSSDIAADARARGLAVVPVGALSPEAEAIVARVKGAETDAPTSGISIAAFVAQLFEPSRQHDAPLTLPPPEAEATR